MTHDALSIIIPVYNDPENIRDCLTALVPTLASDDEVIVVDDASTDDTAAVVDFFPVTLQRMQKNSGPATARNAGAYSARHDILFFIDADILVYEDTLIKVRSYFQENDVDALIGSYDTEPTQQNFISQYKNLSHHFVHQNGRKEAATFWGACGAVKKQAFLDSGGFSTGYKKPSIEDIELGARLVERGGRIHLVKTIQVTHTKKWTLGALIRTDLFDRAIPWTILMLKNKEMNNDLNTDFPQRLSLVLVWLAGLLIPFGFLNTIFWLGAVAALIAMVLLNIQYYRFFKNTKSFTFAVKVFPLHLLYYLYSGVGFIAGLLKAGHE